MTCKDLSAPRILNILEIVDSVQIFILGCFKEGWGMVGGLLGYLILGWSTPSLSLDSAVGGKTAADFYEILICYLDM